MPDEPQDVHASLPAPVDLDTPTPLTVDEIRARAGQRRSVVDVPGVGPVEMRTPVMSELIEIHDRCMNPDGTPNRSEANVQTIILCCPAFSQADAEWLRDANAVVVVNIVRALEEFGVKPVDAKKTAATFRDEPRSDVRMVPGGAAGDDARRVDL
jgi:hypothetical protein